MSETLELQDCRKALQKELDRLDDLGAGLAAIHLSAAIEQLTSNLDAIKRSSSIRANVHCLAELDAPKFMH